MNRVLSRLAAAAVVGLAILGGCAGYGTHKGADAQGIEDLQDPNQPNAERVMIAALRHVILRHRPGGENTPVAINLPPGMRRSGCERIARDVGPEVYPLTEEIAQQGTMPIFHVGRVWLRFEKAKVDVFRPLPELGTNASGQISYQPITVELQGGLRPWKVVYAQPREPGSVPTPMASFMPKEDDPDYWRKWRQAQRRGTSVDEPGQPAPVADDRVMVEVSEPKHSNGGE